MVRQIPPPLDRIPSLINSAHKRDPSPTQPTITHQPEKNSCDSIHEPRPLHALTKKDVHAQTKEKKSEPNQNRKTSVRAPSSPERTSPETPVPPLDGRIVTVWPHPPEPVRPHRSHGRLSRPRGGGVPPPTNYSSNSRERGRRRGSGVGDEGRRIR